MPKGYEPNDLEPIASVCTVGDTGCNSDELYLRKEANTAFQKMVKSGKKAHVKIVAISGYRSYDYQLNLWTTNAQTYGQDYADAYKVTRYNYESWHLRYVGKKAATTCFEKNWTLEEYWGNQ